MTFYIGNSSVNAVISVTSTKYYGKDGSSSSSPGYSCRKIKEMYPSAGDGWYWIDLGGAITATYVHCDMSTDGGGWTRVAQYNGSGTPNYPGNTSQMSTWMNSNTFPTQSGDTANNTYNACAMMKFDNLDGNYNKELLWKVYDVYTDKTEYGSLKINWPTAFTTSAAPTFQLNAVAYGGSTAFRNQCTFSQANANYYTWYNEHLPFDGFGLFIDPCQENSWTNKTCNGVGACGIGSPHMGCAETWGGVSTYHRTSNMIANLYNATGAQNGCHSFQQNNGLGSNTNGKTILYIREPANA